MTRGALLAAVLIVPLLSIDAAAQAPMTASRPSGPVRRLPDGKPDLNGFYQADAGEPIGVSNRIRPWT